MKQPAGTFCRNFVKFSSLLIIFQFIFSGLEAQMRQIYVDPVNADNEVLKISMYKPNEGFVAFTNWIGYTTDSGRSYSQKYISLSNVDYNGYSVNLTFGFGITGVKAFNQDTILVYGNYGFVPAILYSSDQGNTFKLVYQSQLNAQQLTSGITDMSFPQGGSTGFAVEADRIIKTTDGGKSWNSIREDPNSFFSFIELVDNNTLFVFSTNYASPKLLRTINAGTSWQSLNLPPGKIDYASFTSLKNGCLSINFPAALFYTSNAGVSWVQKNNPSINPFNCTRMKFINDSTGYATGDLFTVFKTSDSGKVWEPLPRDNVYTYLLYSHEELRFFDNNQFWAGGGHGFLELTTNGGGIPLPKAYFSIDTSNVNQTGTVSLSNLSRPGYQYNWLINGVSISTNYNKTYTHALSNQYDSITLIVSNGIHSDTSSKLQYFVIPNLPAITSFTTTTGSTGTLITILGSGLGAVSSVSFGGIPATGFTIISANEIRAIVGTGASGNITVSDIHGTYSLPGFTYFPAPAAQAPVISSMLPASGPVGTSVTLQGLGFDSNPANDIIYFGAARATVISASAGQVICKVPSGASFQPVSLLNTGNGLMGYSRLPFNISFADSSNFTMSSFTRVYSFSSIHYLYTKHVIGKDIDGDGKADITLITQTYLGDSIIVFRNLTNGNNFSFDQGNGIGVVPTLGSGKFDLDDLDGDGKPDIVSVTHQAYLDLRKNNSTPGIIQFGNPLILQCPGSTSDVKINDIDGDGRNDIITGLGSSKQGIGIFRNTSVPGNLSFGSPQVVLNGTGAGIVAVGDLDGDGKNDIITYIGNGTGSSQVTCLHNTSTSGNISFDPHVDFPVAGSGSQATSISIADMDNDGKPDLIFANDNQYYCFFRNTGSPGNISFAAPLYYASTNVAEGASVGNLSGNAKPDYLATGGTSNGSFSVMRNVSVPGSPRFDKLVAVGNHIDSYYTNTGDFNADGKSDIIVSTPNSNEFVIFKNIVGDSIHFSLCEGYGSQIDADQNGIQYQWQQFNGTTFLNIADDSSFFGTQSKSLYFNKIPFSWNGRIFRCIVDSQNTSIFVMKVNPLVPPAITISSSDSLICYGSAITFTSAVTDPGSFPKITWQLNGSDIGPDSNQVILRILKEGDQVHAILGSNNACFNYQSDTSNTFIVHLTGTKPSVIIQTADTMICDGADVVFKVIPVSGSGLTPEYDWMINGNYVGLNLDSLPNQIIADGDKVSMIFSSKTGCILPTISNTITMKVNPSHTPALEVSSSADTICQGTMVQFMANATDTGTTVIYQWLKNGQAVGSNSMYYADSSLNNQDLISATISTSPVCALTTTASSNGKKIFVNSASSMSGTISGQSVLTAGDYTSLTAALNINIPTVYIWQDSTLKHAWQNINSTTGATFSYSPKNTGEAVRCIFNFNSSCDRPLSDTSNRIIFTLLSSQIPDTSIHIHFYPNPVSNTLYIDSLSPDDQWQTLEIYNVTGGRLLVSRQVQNQTNVEVDVSTLEPGLYICILRRNSLSPFILKFLKL